ncbi:hypothetical protein [Sphaerisporangium flaviroseum]|uniref:hypothetical protein n=1 Tax=Sphaerisporangium flaviroseum TaxID=509199 RepID=UPI0031EC2865
MSAVVGLLLSAFLLIASAPVESGGDSAQRHTGASAPQAWVEQSSTVPPAFTRAPDPLPSRFLPFSLPVLDLAGTQSPLRVAWCDPEAPFTPQQAALRPADSRGPPLA